MSLREFQRALGDFVASPDLCRAAAADPRWVIGEYELTERELRRLLHSARQPGMKICWSLHRANRFGPIHAVLPLTCRALGPSLRSELDAFWQGALPQDLQFKSEAERFGAFVCRRARAGHLASTVVEDLVGFELAMAELRFLPQRSIKEQLRMPVSKSNSALVLHPCIRLLRFRYNPEQLLAAVMNDRPVPSNLQRGDYFLLVDGKEGAMAIRLIAPELAAILDSFRLGLQPFLSEEETESLLKAELIARWPDATSRSSPAMLP